MNPGDQVQVRETARTAALGIAGASGFVESVVAVPDATDDVPRVRVLVWDVDGGLAGPYELDEGEVVVLEHDQE